MNRQPLVPAPPEENLQGSREAEQDEPPAIGTAIAGESKTKRYVTALILAWFLGMFGADRFYLEQYTIGVLKLFTLGGLGLWVILDFTLIGVGYTKDPKGLPLRGFKTSMHVGRPISIVVALVSFLMWLLIIASFTHSLWLSSPATGV